MGLTVEAIDLGAQDQEDKDPRPSILVVGPRDVGKRSLVRRLVRGARSASGTIPGGVVASHRWSIGTKYYTADVDLWVSHSEESSDDAAKAQALADGCDALVLVFDLSEDASFSRVSQWASTVDLTAFEVLLCVANKADLLPDHHAHETLAQERPLQSEQRERLVENEEPPAPSVGFHRPSESRGLDVRRQEYSAWCLDNGVEYIETCALDEHFDQRISIDGDMQGIQRLRSALHAHMWPGMVLKPKPGAKPVRNLSDGEGSDFSVEYELLEAEGVREVPVSDDIADGTALESRTVKGEESAKRGEEGPPVEGKRYEGSPGGLAGAGFVKQKEGGGEAPAVGLDSRRGDAAGVTGPAACDMRSEPSVEGPADGAQAESVRQNSEGNGPLHLDEAAAMREVEHEGDSEYAEMERIMHEMASARERLSGLPDVARREEAARYAMRMMQMFGGEDSDVEAD